MSHHDKTSSKRRLIYNDNEIDQASSSLEIRVHDRPVVITHWNAVEGEFLCLFQFDVDDCSDTGIATMVKDCEGNPICLCCDNNQIQVDMPGRYKLIKRGILNNARVTSQYISSRHVS